MSLFKIVLVILIAMILFFVGLMVGYGYIGDGNPTGVFSGKLWQHIFEFFL
ncbi:hypothetical protein RT43_GL000117 [Enterococcus italicus DSM 15952]|nr:hypothetical protein RT43_GL000117 [Enterococcus italicus DSM 15952]